jgi:hypothetical protein
MATIRQDDLIRSTASALQFISKIVELKLPVGAA